MKRRSITIYKSESEVDSGLIDSAFRFFPFFVSLSPLLVVALVTPSSVESSVAPFRTGARAAISCDKHCMRSAHIRWANSQQRPSERRRKMLTSGTCGPSSILYAMVKSNAQDDGMRVDDSPDKLEKREGGRKGMLKQTSVYTFVQSSKIVFLIYDVVCTVSVFSLVKRLQHVICDVIVVTDDYSSRASNVDACSRSQRCSPWWVSFSAQVLAYVTFIPCCSFDFFYATVEWIHVW